MAAPSKDDAFRRVYEANVSYVLHSLRRLGVRPADVEDVAHDVFVAVHRHFEEWDRTRPVKPWLFGFAFRIASDHRKLKRHTVERAIDSESELRPAGQRPDRDAEAEEKRRALQEALQMLDLEQRAVFILHDIDGTSAPEIAKELGIPLNTVYSRIRLARKKLAELLQAHRPTPSAIPAATKGAPA